MDSNPWTPGAFPACATAALVKKCHRKLYISVEYLWAHCTNMSVFIHMV